MEVLSLFSDHTETTSRIVANRKKCEYEELRFRRGSPLACGVMGIASSFYWDFHVNNVQTHETLTFHGLQVREKTVNIHDIAMKVFMGKKNPVI